LENVPEGKNDWKPHEKSMPMGYLAALVATMPGWIDSMVNQDEVDVTSPAMAKLKAQPPDRNVELIEMFNASMAKARTVLGETNDEHLKKPWKFLMGGRVVSERPRYAMIRDTVFSHWAHHRGQ